MFMGGHQDHHDPRLRNMGRNYLFFGGMVFLVMLAGGWFLLSDLFLDREEEREEDAHWHRATRISIGDPQLRVLQLLGAASCQRENGEEMLFIYRPPDSSEVPSGCEPFRGDLVVHIGSDGLVAGYEPEHGVRSAVRSEVDQMRFRRSAGVGESEESEEPLPSE